MANDDFEEDDLTENKDTRKGRSKHNPAPGVYDLRYDAKGNRTKYNGPNPFQSRVNYQRKGVKLPGQENHPTLKAAKQWRDDKLVERKNITNPLLGQRLIQERLIAHKVSDLIQAFIWFHTFEGDRTDIVIDLNTLMKLQASWLGQMNLAAVKKYHAQRYIAERLRSTYGGEEKHWKATKQTSAGHVARERNTLQTAFEEAIKYNWLDCCGYIENIFSRIRIKGSGRTKSKVLLAVEEEALYQGYKKLRGTNEYYAALGQNIALDTGMHREEITNLRWSDCAFYKGFISDRIIWGSNAASQLERRIRIRKHKNDKKVGRKGITIVMPVDTFIYLTDLYHALNEGYLPRPYQDIPLPPNFVRPKDKPDSFIMMTFKGKPMKSEDLGELFDDTKQRCKEFFSPDEQGDTTQLRDLRRTANMGFLSNGPNGEPGLDEAERMIMLGQVDQNIQATYKTDEAHLSVIQDKLDKKTLQVYEELIRDASGKVVGYDLMKDEFRRPKSKGMPLLDYISHHSLMLGLIEYPVSSYEEVFHKWNRGDGELQASHQTRWAKMKPDIRQRSLHSDDAGPVVRQFMLSR